MTAELVVLVGAGMLLFVASVSGRLDRVWLTEPLVATALGVIVGLTLVDLELESPLILILLELTLALVLFSDASRIDVGHLRDGYEWPLRMLLIGLPVAVAMGTLVSGWYLSLPFGLALLLGVVLAPTDAALAEPILESDSVPERVRQTLNVESGLNDGLALPFLLIAIGVIDAEEGQSVGDAIWLVITQLGIGIVGGLVLGWVGAKLIGKGAETGWMNPLHQRVAAVALALSGFAAVQLLGGSGFVATFIAGGLMSHLLRPRPERVYQFAEAEGHALVLLAFFVVGAGPGAELLRRGAPTQAVVIAVVSLFLLRPISIWLSLLGQRLQWQTVVFLGWFGPRGLATVVFVLVALEELGTIDPLVLDTLSVVVLASIALHGLSAVPMSRWLGRIDMAEDMPEMGEAFRHPTRR
ncbi:MAG TPA: cation:proton antiporter [Acidimicrobiia bacterium]|nr:cation:proton antiporter [Acidimicrobiia bacterium]